MGKTNSNKQCNSNELVKFIVEKLPCWITRWRPKDAYDGKEGIRKDIPKGGDDPSPLPKFTQWISCVEI
jgi:hypothetical protein